ncbi:DUF5685 family protein [Streptomyces sp. NPDC058766]|uniref:DUF5685 family protein n=1 Tax=Streptomyces sp. NPDC058766 TaxID=3346630 RepID=UPI0036BDE18E
MFGIVRPCRHRLGEKLAGQWMAHLCGLCLALRGDHGQLARLVTNYDGLLVSALTEAQAQPGDAGRRTAGPCPLRGMRTASVAHGEGARLAAAVSLVLASAKVRDHIGDGDGLLARRPVARAARRVAASWDAAAARTGTAVGFDTALLVDAVDRQTGIEALAGPGTPLLTVTEPTESATAAAFAHTAVLAGRPHNARPLAEAGRLFGRLAHLLDAVEDLHADAASGAWNPIAATGTPLPEVRRLADDAVHGVRLALNDVEFTDAKLVHLLLVHEVRRSVDRAFGTVPVCASHQGGGPYGQRPPQGPYGRQGPYGSQQNPYAGGGGHPYAGGGGAYGGGGFGGGAPVPQPPQPRGFWAGCGMFWLLCCTCKLCCAKEYEGPWSRKKREGCCRECDCGGCDCCCPCDC